MMRVRVPVRSVRAGTWNAVLVGCLAGALTGCTLIGFGIGAAADHKEGPKRETLSGWQIESVHPGDDLELLLKDGGLVKGKYRGLEPVPQQEYAEAYARSREANASALALPQLGPGARVTTTGSTTECELVGFEYGRVVLRQAQPVEATHIELSRTERIADREGASVDGHSMEKLVAAGRVPLLSQIVLENSSGRIRVRLEDVSRLDLLKGRHTGKIVGVVVGAVVDTLVIVAIVHALDTTGKALGEGFYRAQSQSCPFVYSFDGERYVLDAQGFAGAIFSAAATPDWSNLSHLHAVGGEYRLRLTNEQQEIQYVDELKLLVVDRPRGRARVVPSLVGVLHTFTSPVAPIRAVDLKGSDVLPLLRDADGAWVSNPAGWISGEAEGARDGLILEFPRPAATNSVKLAFRLQSTPWAASLGRHVLRLQGRALSAWYERMNTDTPARIALLGALVREGLLNVRIWDGEQWRTVGFLGVVGSAVSRDQAVEADIRGIPGSIVRVRLDATPGLWIVGDAVADYTPDVALHVTELAPSRAQTGDGRDIRALLSDADGRFHVMALGRDAAELFFHAPPARDGEERSVVVRTSGYYTVLVPTEGEPQTALFDQLVSEPGAFGRYSLDLLRSELHEAMARESMPARPAWAPGRSGLQNLGGLGRSPCGSTLAQSLLPDF